MAGALPLRRARDQIVQGPGVVAGIGGQLAEGGSDGHIRRGDGVRLLEKFARIRGVAEFHFHSAESGEPGCARFSEPPGQHLRRRDRLVAFGVRLALFGDPDVLAQGIQALAGIAFGVFQEHAVQEQAFGDDVGGAAPFRHGDEGVFAGCSLIEGNGLRVDRFRGFANAVCLIRHVLDERAEDPETGER